METIAIVFTIDNSFVVPAYIAIKSLIDNAQETTRYEIVILCDGVWKKNKKIIAQLVEGTRHSIDLKKLNTTNLYIANTSYGWPRVVYARLFLCDVLPYCDKIIYSDVDVFFKGDLSEVWKTDMQGYEIAAVPAEYNDESAIIHQYYKENKKEKIFMSGFMLMNLSMMRKENWVNRCKKNINQFAPKLRMFDLELVNLTATSIKILPFRYVFLQSFFDNVDLQAASDFAWINKLYSIEDINYEKQNAVIIHYAGEEGKPWLRKRVPEYYLNYMKKISLYMKIQNEYQRLKYNFRVLIRWLYRKTIKKQKNRVIE